MSACERCWAEAGGDPDEYRQMHSRGHGWPRRYGMPPLWHQNPTPDYAPMHEVRAVPRGGPMTKITITLTGQDAADVAEYSKRIGRARR